MKLEEDLNVGFRRWLNNERRFFRILASFIKFTRVSLGVLLCLISLLKLGETLSARKDSIFVINSKSRISSNFELIDINSTCRRTTLWI